MKTTVLTREQALDSLWHLRRWRESPTNEQWAIDLYDREIVKLSAALERSQENQKNQGPS